MAKTIDRSYFAEPTKARLFLSLSRLDEDIASIRNNPLCYKTKSKNDADLPNYHEAMTGEHSEEFKKAMDSELEGLIKRNTWSLVPRGNHKVIPGTWAFRIKRKPDGSLNKFKARFCVRGDIQKKTNSLLEDEPYSPVISWSTV